MRFRTRLLITLLGTVVLPWIILSWFVRDNMNERLQLQYEQQFDDLVAVVQQRLREYAYQIDHQLVVLGSAMQKDNRFRSSVSGLDGTTRSIDGYLVGYAAEHARISGLSYFQLQNEGGMILSSGHFRGEYGRVEQHSELSRQRLSDGGSEPGVVRGRMPDRSVLALARVDSIRIAGAFYFLTAGFVMDSSFVQNLSPAGGISICIDSPADIHLRSLAESLHCLSAGGRQNIPVETRQIKLRFVDASEGIDSSVRVVISRSKADLYRLLSDLDDWFLAISGIVFGLGLLSMIRVSRKFSQPLSELVYKTSRIDLNRLNVSFKTGRTDEIGDLSRVLDELTRRLKRSAESLKNAERRLAIGELARQVNHDIKNGLTPIRNIVRHFSSLARDDAKQLADVVRDREASLESSIGYLEELAGNYARLSPELRLVSHDVNQLVSEISREYIEAHRVIIRLQLGPTCTVCTDKIAFRRILENLLDNAFDSLHESLGTVEIRTAITVDEDTGDKAHARIEISDTGSGMKTEEVDSAFKDFFTTKAQGTGLGLSIVRRLTMDLNGSVHIESSFGDGTRVTLLFPIDHR